MRITQGGNEYEPVVSSNYCPPYDSSLFNHSPLTDAIKTKRLSLCAQRSAVSASAEGDGKEMERKMKTSEHESPGVSFPRSSYILV